MSAIFCGSPIDHDAHEGPKGFCQGVQRQYKTDEVIIEKYEPTEMAEDGTAYSSVLIIIEDKDGNINTFRSDRVRQPYISVDYQRELNMDHARWDATPVVESVTLTFEPCPLDGHKAFEAHRREKNV